MKVLLPVLAALSFLFAGCSTVEYAVKEKFGIHKRDILVARVGDTREAQGEASQQFKSALEQFTALTGTGGGALQDKYEKLSADYERCEKRAATVRERIADVERVSGALFAEWKTELSQYSDASLRAISERELAETQARCSALVASMQRAASRMQPVLTRFKDQVLFLKHNLNAQVVARLGDTNVHLQGEVSGLIAEMEASIREADAFIRDMRPEAAK